VTSSTPSTKPSIKCKEYLGFKIMDKPVELVEFYVELLV